MGINVGIDLGTTYSAVAVFNDAIGQVEELRNSDGNVCTPSVTHIEKGKVTIGEEAKLMQSQGDLNAAAFYKSMMGEKGYTLYLDGKEYTPEELSGLYLKELIKDVSKHNNVNIEGAVITCPAYFNESQRLATQNAGVKAGLKVLKIINEPTAAIIAYGLTGSQKKNVMVYDLGGGTFDVTIAEVNGTNVKVLTTNGNHQLGGKNWDAEIAEELKRRFFAEFNINIEDNQEDFYQLKVQCEEIKKGLTTMSVKTATVQSGGFTGRYEITRQFFDEATYSLLNETILLIDKCFSEIGGGFGWKSLDEVVLVGGSTRMPQVKEFIQREYGREPVTKSINVDTIVASGAAMQAKLCVDNRLVIGGDSRPNAPTDSGSGKQQLVITGSSVQDITSHSLGMLAFTKDETYFVNSIIIKKNSPYSQPFGKAYAFSGDKMDVYVLQGESTEPRDCTLLYLYTVSGFVSRKKTDFELFYTYNQDGVVEVTIKAKDGSNLTVAKSIVNESINEVINRLLLEKEQRRLKAAQGEIMCIVDTSGSMYGSPLDLAKKALKDFVNELDLSRFSVSIVSFNDVSTALCQNEKNKGTINNAISSLAISGGTSATPLKSYGQQFSTRDTNRIIVVMTDGAWSYQATEKIVAQNLKNDDVIIYAIGFGDADASFLNEIASEKGAKKVDLSKLSQTLLEIAGSIATEG